MRLFPLVLLLSLTACGLERSPLPSLEPFAGDWKASVTVTPMSMDSTQYLPPPMTYEATLTATPGDSRLLLSGFCPTAPGEIELGRSLEKPYWRGRVDGCAALRTNPCDIATFALTWVETELDLAPGQVADDDTDAQRLVGEGSGETTACGSTIFSWVRFTAERLPKGASTAP